MWKGTVKCRYLAWIVIGLRWFKHCMWSDWSTSKLKHFGKKSSFWHRDLPRGCRAAAWHAWQSSLKCREKGTELLHPPPYMALSSGAYEWGKDFAIVWTAPGRCCSCTHLSLWQRTGALYLWAITPHVPSSNAFSLGWDRDDWYCFCRYSPIFP